MYEEDGTQLALDKKLEALKFSHCEFPVFGSIEDFFGDEWKQKQEFVDEETQMYRETHLEKRLEVKNVASLPCRV